MELSLAGARVFMGVVMCWSLLTGPGGLLSQRAGGPISFRRLSLCVCLWRVGWVFLPSFGLERVDAARTMSRIAGAAVLLLTPQLDLVGKEHLTPIFNARGLCLSKMSVFAHQSHSLMA